MKKSTLCLGLLAATSLVANSAQGAIVVTNGDFESPDIAASAQVQDVPEWFDSTGDFSSWHRGESADPQENGTQMLAMGNTGFAYQSLGTLDLDAGSLNWSIDKARFADGNGSAEMTIRFFSGNATGTAADGTDISTLGLTQIGADIALSAIGTDASGTGVVNESGSVDLTGLTGGTQIWIELSTANGFAPFDNVTVTEVPEPGSLALLGLGGLLIARRRRIA